MQGRDNKKESRDKRRNLTSTGSTLKHQQQSELGQIQPLRIAVSPTCGKDSITEVQLEAEQGSRGRPELG